jgi:VanZ family protein
MRQAPPVAPLTLSIPRALFPLFFWLLLIFICSCFHKTPIPPSRIIPWDKIAHATEYAILGYLAARAAYFAGVRWLQAHFMAVTIVFGFFYAISDEWHQYFVPGRSADPADAAADLIGVFLGCVIFWALLRKRRRGAIVRPQS